MVKRINKLLMCLALAVLLFYLSSMNYRHSESAGRTCPSCTSESKCMAIYNKNNDLAFFSVSRIEQKRHK